MTIAAEACRKLRSLDPVETGAMPKLPVFEGIEAVAFDIYGTLLISAAGDISLADESVSVNAMSGILRLLGEQGRGVKAEEMAEFYHGGIDRQLDLRRDDGITYPEVEIREVWRDAFQSAGIEGVPETEMERLAIAYECEVNPVWLMPGATELLASLKQAEIPIGIVSNAQFYTQPIFEELAGASLHDIGFEESLSQWSFEAIEGKPSHRLYEQLAASCIEQGIDTGKVFYLGNDFQKDVLPAKEVGFLAGLFAGDKRSLRTREVTLKDATIRTDAVITALNQVRDVLKIG